MSKISVYMLIIGLLTGITGITFFFYGMNSDQSEIPVAFMSESSTDDAKEAVKVRGDWEVTVSNPDGSDPTVHNFRNEINEGAFDLLSRLLLPADHENSTELEWWEIRLGDKSDSVGGYEICRMTTAVTGLLPALYENSVLVAEPIKTDEYSLDEYSLNGLRLTGSCMAKMLENVEDDNGVIDINQISVNGLYPKNTSLIYGIRFATKFFGGAAGEIEAGGENEEDAIVIGSPGQMISLTVDFTFE